ncbi:MAG: (Fe-S)-binding protein [Candidatus Altiarchaeota archaeon]|nr:(Fe-S)-binding protein [Candidatus Altiarchaeota archaeon]
MFKGLFERFGGGNTLYYPGCLTKFALKDKQAQYEGLLKKLGVEYIKLADVEQCCGIPVLNAGYREDFERLKRKNLAIFKEYDVKRVITNCPGCCHTLKNEYGLDAVHITELLARNIGKVAAVKGGDITYHDPCHLGRWGGIYDQPRDVLRKRGFEVKELSYSRSDSMCCGGGGGLRQNDRATSDAVARNVLKNTKTKRLVTACPMCYYHLKENAQGVEVLDYSDVLKDD